MTQPSLSRHQIREKALQALFQLRTNPEADRDEAIRQALLSDFEGNEDEVELPDAPYLHRIVNGVLDHDAAINEAIRPYLKKWSLERLAKTDAIILQIAAYEMLYAHELEVPQRVALNEAIELAKQYGEEKSSRFINGVLSNLMSETEESGPKGV